MRGWLSLSWVEGREGWPKFSAVVMVERTRTDVRSNMASEESAYFILSDAKVGAKRLHEIIRGHWGIENSLHWVLDVTFEEDLSRIRLKNAAENMATIRRAILNLLRTAPKPPKKRKKPPIRIASLFVGFHRGVIRGLGERRIPYKLSTFRCFFKL